MMASGLDPSKERDRVEGKALGWVAMAAFAAIVYVVAPIAFGILLGTLLAFIMQPLYALLVEKRLGLNPSAIITVAITSAVLTGSLVGLGWLLASKGTAHTRELIAALGPDAPGGGALAALGQELSRFGFPPEELPNRARELAADAASKVAGGASAVLSVTATTLLALFFMMLSMHFVLRNADLVMQSAKQTSPLKPEWTAALLTEFRRVGKTTLFGTLVTGVAQGLLATIGYWFCGVPDPIFYGAATAVASLIPGVGTMLIWVPVGVVMILTHHPLGGIADLIWGGLVVVGVSDYLIRPRLVRGENELPSLVTFASLFGGVEAFGLKGLILGPLIMSLAIAVLRLYAREQQQLVET